MADSINKYSDFTDLEEHFKEYFEEKIGELREEDRVDVEIPESIDEYELDHALGAILIKVQSGKLEDKSNNATGATIQNHDIVLRVGYVGNYYKENMLPLQFVQFIMDKLNEHEKILNNRPHKKIKVTSWDFVFNEKSLWGYAVLANIPKTYVEPKYRNY